MTIVRDGKVRRWAGGRYRAQESSQIIDIVDIATVVVVVVVVSSASYVDDVALPHPSEGQFRE